MADKHTRVGIGVFVIRDGKFLMMQRHGAHGEGTWAPPGGHLEFNETFEETTKREVKEETGLDVTNFRFGAVTNDIFKDEGKHYVTVWILCDWAGGEPIILEPEKCVEQRWCTFDDLPEPLFVPFKNLLNSEFIASIRQQVKTS